MKRFMRIAALFVLLAAAVFWLAAGANRGWTKNKIEKKTVDEITGIEGVTYEKKFVPGVDFLAITGLIAAALAGASFLFRTKTNPIHQTQDTRHEN